jgi:hypothetical protein
MLPKIKLKTVLFRNKVLLIISAGLISGLIEIVPVSARISLHNPL